MEFPPSFKPPTPRPRGPITADQLQARIERFADLAGDLVPESTRSRRLQHYGSQLMRSSSSAGATYAEARSATSHRDFEHKLHECAKELRESLTWLNRLAHASHQPLYELRNECDQLIAILTASIITARNSARTN